MNVRQNKSQTSSNARGQNAIFGELEWLERKGRELSRPNDTANTLSPIFPALKLMKRTDKLSKNIQTLIRYATPFDAKFEAFGANGSGEQVNVLVGINVVIEWGRKVELVK